MHGCGQPGIQRFCNCLVYKLNAKECFWSKILKVCWDQTLLRQEDTQRIKYCPCDRQYAGHFDQRYWNIGCQLRRHQEASEYERFHSMLRNDRHKTLLSSYDLYFYQFYLIVNTSQLCNFCFCTQFVMDNSEQCLASIIIL